MENLSSAHLALLHSTPCLAQSEGQARDALFKSAYCKTLQKGQFLFHRGDDAIGYLGVLKGRLKISTQSADGKPLTLSYFQPLDWFGEISLVDGVSRTHDCEALDECEIMIIPKPIFEQYVLGDIKLLRLVTQQICQRLRLMMNLVEQATIQPLQERLANRLLILKESSGDAIHVNQQDLASMMGVSRQSVSKILLHWAELNWIKLEYNHITILEAEELHKLCITPSVPQS